MNTRSIAALTFGLGLVAACGDAPRPARAGNARAPDPHGSMPADHPPTAPQKPSDTSQFAGRAILHGALASASEGALFVMLRVTGTGGPTWAYVVRLDDPDAEKLGLAPAADGTRVLTFALNRDTTVLSMELPIGVALEVAVMYDPDGDADTKVDQVLGTAPAQAGDTGIVVDLDPDRGR